MTPEKLMYSNCWKQWRDWNLLVATAACLVVKILRYLHSVRPKFYQIIFLTCTLSLFEFRAIYKDDEVAMVP